MVSGKVWIYFDLAEIETARYVPRAFSFPYKGTRSPFISAQALLLELYSRVKSK